MAEYAVSFTTGGAALVGVFTEAHGSDPQKPAVVFLNAGLIPRTGPNRLSVRLARESTRLGLNAFRFDLSGIGDSSPRTDGLPVREGALRDVREAFDYLASWKQVSSFVLVGFCSGADLAFRVSLIDTRVTGLVLIDGLPYRNLRSRANDELLQLRRRFANGFWRRLVSPDGPLLRRVRWRVGRGAMIGSSTKQAELAPNRRDVPPLAEAERGLCEMIARGVKIMAVFTEGRGYNYQRQFADLFPRLPADAVRIEYLRGADHTFNMLANQDRLVSVISQWAGQYVQAMNALTCSLSSVQ